jgi:plastocyanin
MKNRSLDFVMAMLVLALAGLLLVAGCASSSPLVPVTPAQQVTPLPTSPAALGTTTTTILPTVITTTSLAQTVTPLPSSGKSVSIKNLEFDPIAITVKSGTSVTWTNEDAVPHTVTSKTPSPVAFDSGTMQQGSTFTYTFTQTGSYPYFCTIHTFMTGTVIVVP